MASDLFGEIEENLKQSEFLLVVCSPRIVQSKWCLKEIETFIKYRGRDNVLAVIIEGEPNQAFPPILLEQGEPLAADLRGRNKREVLRYARKRMLRLVAPLLYCSYDELYQRHRVYRMRRAFALASLAAVAALGFGAVTVKQNREINENYQARLANQSRHLARKSAELLNQGDRETALLVALEALPGGSGDDSRPYVAEARIALENALYTYSMDTRLSPVKVLEHKGVPDSEHSDFHPEENVLLTLDGDGRIYVWDCGTNENICCFEETGRFCGDARFAGEHRVVAKTSKGVLCFDYRTMEILWEWKFPECGAESCRLIPLASPSSVRNGIDYVWDFNAEAGRIVCAAAYLEQEFEQGTGMEKRLFERHLFWVLDADTGEGEAWKPEAVYRRLEENPDLCITLMDISLSPDGQKLLVMEQGSVSGVYGAGNYCMDILPVFGNEAFFSQEYPDSYGVYAHVWLDSETLGAVEALEPSTGVSNFSYRQKWRFTCLDMESGEVRFTYEDASISLGERADVRTNYPAAEGAEAACVIDVAFGNVMVCLDWHTGEAYSRIEDRSAVRPIFISDAASDGMLLCTADGYVFFSNARRDYLFSSDLDTQHYYLGLKDIRKAEWHKGKAYFYTDSAVYCYSATAVAGGVLGDAFYVPLEIGVMTQQFGTDSDYLLVMGTEAGDYKKGRVCVYDAGSLELCWQDICKYAFKLRTAVLLEGDRVAYVDGEEDGVRIHSVRSGEDVFLELEGYERDDWDNLNTFGLRPAGEDVAVWGERSANLDTEWRSRENMDASIVWLADAGQGAIKRRWSYREIIEQLPESLLGELEPISLSGGLSIRVITAAVTADGHHAVICSRVDGDDHEERFQRTYVAVWDLETGRPVPQPEAVWRGLVAGYAVPYYDQEGWLSPEGSLAVFYDAQERLLRVADLAEGAVLHELPVDGIGSAGISFTPDGDHLIFQDSVGRLCVYCWREGVYTMQETVPRKEALTFQFYEKGQILRAATLTGTMINGSGKTTHLYRSAGAGRYELETTIGSCQDSDGRRAVLVQDTEGARLYPYYTLDDMIAQAEAILKGRELTELERKNYLID